MTAVAEKALPSTLRIGLSRGGAEVRQFFRERDAVVFTFALPTVILILLGSSSTSRWTVRRTSGSARCSRPG